LPSRIETGVGVFGAGAWFGFEGQVQAGAEKFGWRGGGARTRHSRAGLSCVPADGAVLWDGRWSEWERPETIFGARRRAAGGGIATARNMAGGCRHYL